METKLFGPCYIYVLNTLRKMGDLDLIQEKVVGTSATEADYAYRMLNPAQVDFYPAHLLANTPQIVQIWGDLQ